MLPELAASDSPQDHADWLELLALVSADRNSSYQDLVAVIRRTGSMDALEFGDETDQGSEGSQQVADDAFAELDLRARSCGGLYPFELHNQFIQLSSSEHEIGPYIFMLLLKTFGLDTGPRGFKTASHFECLATEAARRYLGGDDCGAEAYHFGFPRSSGPGSFKEALEELCRLVGEGGGPNNARARLIRNQKDGKLDLVAWRHFPDRRRGKLVVFGQCAAGANYQTKLTELLPSGFSSLYLLDQILPNPVLFFFVPLCVDDDWWLKVVANQAILFDRCRITALLGGPPLSADLQARTKEWCTFVLESRLRQDQ
ncbi:MAG TPA: hypothetical protein VFB74_02295 [Kribbellaceae bacterium]|nr:hypothetical protein [Kribbellaceae bacterium]